MNCPPALEISTELFPLGVRKKRRFLSFSNFAVVNHPDNSRNVFAYVPDPVFGASAKYSQSTLRNNEDLSLRSHTVEFRKAKDPMVTKPFGILPSRRSDFAIDTTGQSTVLDLDPDGTSQFRSNGPDSQILTMDYGVNGNLDLFNRGGFAPVAYDYDSQGHLMSMTIGNNQQTSRTFNLTYDANGHLDSIENPLGEFTFPTFDLLGRMIELIRPGGETITIEYDDENGTVDVFNPDRTDLLGAHDLVFDGRGRLTNYRAPLPPSVPFGYVPISDFYQYDADGKIIQNGVDADDGIVTYEYDEYAQIEIIDANYIPIFETMAQNSVITYTRHPELDLLENIDMSDGWGNHFRHNAPLLTEDFVIDPSGDFRIGSNISYNPHGQISSRTAPIWIGNANPGVFPSIVNFEFTDGGLLTNARMNVPNSELILDRDSTSGLINEVMLNGSSEVYSYNEFGEIESKTFTYQGLVLSENITDRDGLGRIKSYETVGGGVDVSKDYEYDLNGRLSKSYDTPIVSTRYIYDTNGNRTRFEKKDESTGGILDNGNATYDSTDRFLDEFGQFIDYHYLESPQKR